MGGFFGTISKSACATDLFYGTDYNSHLGTRRGGMATYDKENGFTRSIHNLESSYFRTKFEPALDKFVGNAGIGIISDTDATFNFLVSMAYTQLFNLLCERADDKYGGRLPVHVRCLIDEAANIGQIPNLEKLMATIRSREISACLVLQAQSQLKALYKDNMDTIIGNCDASLFLGGKEETTLKSWNSLLGKETIDMYNTSVTKGTQESHGQNFQKLGKDLMSVDELAVMDGGKCLLQIRGVRPFLSRKYDITRHPNYKYLSDYAPKNAFDIEKFLSTKMPMRPGELYRNYEVTAEDLEAPAVG